MPVTRVDFDLPAGETAQTALTQLVGKIKAIFVTRSGVSAQIGYAYNWAITTAEDNSLLLSADLYTDGDLDLTSTTVTVSGLSAGNLTANMRGDDQTLLPLLFF